MELVKNAEARIETLEGEVKRMDEERLQITIQLEQAKKGVEWRDAEIKRLNGEAELDRNWDRLNAETDVQIQAEKIQQLEEKMDFLNTERQKFESKCTENQMEIELLTTEKKELGEKYSHASQEIIQLHAKLNAMKSKLNVLQVEKSEDFKYLQSGTVGGIDELKKANAHIEELKKTISKLKDENEKMQASQSQISQLYDAYQKDKSIFADALQKKIDDFTELERVNFNLGEQMEKIGDALDEKKSQVEKLLKENASLQGTLDMTRETLSSFQASVTHSERTYGELEQTLRAKMKELSVLVEEKTGLKQKLQFADNRNQEFEALVVKLENKLAELQHNLDSKSQNLERAVFTQKNLEGERSSLKTELDLLITQLDEEKKARLNFEMLARESKLQLEQCESLLKSSSTEKSDLFGDYSKKLERLNDLEVEARNVSRENVQLKSKLEELSRLDATIASYRETFSNAQIELSRLHREILEWKNKQAAWNEEKATLLEVITNLKVDYGSDSSKISQLTTSVRELQNSLHSTTLERDSAKRDLDELSERLNSVQHGLGENSSRQNASIQRLQSDIFDWQQKYSSLTLQMQQRSSEFTDISARYEKLRVERDQLASRLQTSQLDCQNVKDSFAEMKAEASFLRSSLEEATKLQNSLEGELRIAKQTAANFESEIGEVKLLLKQSDATRSSLQSQLQEKIENVRKEQELVAALKSQLSILGQQVTTQQKDYSQLKQSLRVLDSKHDELQAELDLKSEQIAALNSSKLVESQSIAEKIAQIQSLQAQILHAGESLHAKEKEVKSAMQKLERTVFEKNRLEEESKVRIQENRTLADDVANMSKENQYLNGELQRTNAQHKNLVMHTEQLSSRIHFAEEKSTMVENEKQQLMHQYRAVCNENSRLEENLHTLELEKQEAFAERRHQQQEVTQLLVRLQNLEGENHRLMCML